MIDAVNSTRYVTIFCFIVNAVLRVDSGYGIQQLNGTEI